MDDFWAPIPRIYVDELEYQWLLDQCGVDDLVSIPAAEVRTVFLPPERSDLVCPEHLRNLKPDACRPCAWLADWLASTTKQPTQPSGDDPATGEPQ